MSHKQPNLQLSLIALALAAAGLTNTAYAQQNNDSQDAGKVVVTGEGDKLGAGLMVNEDSSKNRSTVTRAQIDKTRSSSNPFQLLELLPGVNAYSFDGTGLFGGQLKVRGFNADQLGFTINGAPVNDSGNFAVFPQEYTDSENLCVAYVTQGSPDNDAPHVGASGGNVGLVTCKPKSTFGGKVELSGGQRNFGRVFARVDVPFSKEIRSFVSVSKTQANKFKGMGKADRDHLDAGLDWDIASGLSLSTSLLYNKAVNNNILSLTKSDIDKYGTRLDFSTNIPQHVRPVAGSAQSDAANFNATAAGTTSFGTNAYYGYSLNPFENYLFTARLGWAINDKASLSVEPYYWYGYGTGGTQQTTLAESNSNTRVGRGISDLNGDGDALDTVGIYRGSVTKTNRPGVNVKLTYNYENHRLMVGTWYEHAKHRQTQPATFVDNNGVIGDIWLRSNLVRRIDGSIYQGRDWSTISTGKSIFAQDTISLMNDKLELTLGIKRPEIQRDFTNSVSDGANSAGNYQATRSYASTLPYLGARWQITPEYQVFGNVTKNSRAPSNFVQSGWVRTPTIVNGQVTAFALVPNDTIRPETSVNIEGGLRINNSSYSASATIFQTNFKDRLTSTFNDVLQVSTDANSGNVRLQGLELEAGTKPINGFSFYGSLSLTDSKILTNLPVGAGLTLPTSGKEYPDVPKVQGGLQVQWSQGPMLVSLNGKYTGKRYATLMNDEVVPQNTVFNLSAAYRFASSNFFKKPTVRFNVTNLFNKNYYVLNAGSGSNIRPTNGQPIPGYASIANSGIPTYYAGAPRFMSITLSSEF